MQNDLMGRTSAGARVELLLNADGSIAAGTSGSATSANQTLQLTQETASAAALGTKTDAPATDGLQASSWSVVALGKGLYIALASLLTAFLARVPVLGQALAASSVPVVLTAAQMTALNNPSYTGQVAIVVDTPQTAQRALYVNCTVPGNVTVVFSDASTLAIPVAVGVSVFPFSVTGVNTAGTTATATYANLK